ncbi:RidA family protein [Sphingomonas sp. UYP23]
MTIVRIEESERMSQAVVHRDTVYLAGQVGTPGDDVEAQTSQVLAKIDDMLRRAGSGRDRLLRANILLADMADYDAMNTVWDAWIADVGKPTRATYGVGPAVPRHDVEIIITAAMP